jgi:leucyl aminopeptidase
VVSEREIKGKSGEATWLSLPSNTPIARKVVLVGLGKPESWTLESLRQAAAAICRTAHRQKANRPVANRPLCYWAIAWLGLSRSAKTS